MEGLGVSYLPFVIALFCAALDWLAVARRRRHLEHIFKPATLVALLIGVWLLTCGAHDAWQARFFLPGLVFSLVGDVLLMLSSESLFRAGLVAFLSAHLCYIVGLNPTLPPATAFLMLLPLTAIDLALYAKIAAGLRRSDKEKMLIPVAAYSAVLGLMVFSAWATLLRPGWTVLRRGLVVAGASLFFASDTMLAWDRFVAPSSSARLRIHITYHLGQMALAASIALIG